MIEMWYRWLCEKILKKSANFNKLIMNPLKTHLKKLHPF
jgi:hypothetical protein